MKHQRNGVFRDGLASVYCAASSLVSISVLNKCFLPTSQHQITTVLALKSCFQPFQILAYLMSGSSQSSRAILPEV